jgi:hypothetical protein
MTECNNKIYLIASEEKPFATHSAKAALRQLLSLPVLPKCYINNIKIDAVELMTAVEAAATESAIDCTVETMSEYDSMIRQCLSVIDPDTMPAIWRLEAAQWLAAHPDNLP